MTRWMALAMLVVALGVAGPARAYDGRFALIPAGEGALRLDTRTGAIAYCGPKGAGWTCESVADDRLALEREIDRLAGENASLARELEAVRAALARRSPAREEAPAALPPAVEPPAAEPPAPRVETPPQPEATDASPHSEAGDIDRLMALFERMVRRFHDVVESLRQRHQPRERL